MNRSQSRSSAAQGKSKKGQRRSQSAQPKGRSASGKKTSSQSHAKSAPAGRKTTQSRSKTASRGAAKTSRSSTARKGAKAGKTTGRSAKSTKSSARSGSRAGSRNQSGRGGPGAQAIGMLIDDHRMVQKLFKQAERKRDDTDSLQQIVEQACSALTQHAEIEEQYFYPEMREASEEQDMIAEAEVEHASAKQLIGQLEQMSADDDRYAATFKVLGEYVNHHIKEEENEIFPAARKAQITWEALTDALMARERGTGAGAEATARSGARKTAPRSLSGAAGEQRMQGSTEPDEDAAGAASEEDIEQSSRSRGRGGAGAGGVGAELEEPRGNVDEGTDETSRRSTR